MPDISMCLNSECSSRNHCYRFTAIADGSGWQSYGEFNCPDGEDRCKNFMPNDAAKQAEKRKQTKAKNEKNSIKSGTGPVP